MLLGHSYRHAWLRSYSEKIHRSVAVDTTGGCLVCEGPTISQNPGYSPVQPSVTSELMGSTCSSWTRRKCSTDMTVQMSSTWPAMWMNVSATSCLGLLPRQRGTHVLVKEVGLIGGKTVESSSGRLKFRGRDWMREGHLCPLETWQGRKVPSPLRAFALP